MYLNIFNIFSRVSVVDFQEINVCWVLIQVQESQKILQSLLVGRGQKWGCPLRSWSSTVNLLTLLKSTASKESIDELSAFLHADSDATTPLHI